MLLSGHAAGNADDKGRLFLLQLFHAAHDAEDSVLGGFTDGTGIEDNEISLIFVLGKGAAHFFKQPLYLLAIGDVQLTAEAAYISLKRTFSEDIFYFIYYRSIIVQDTSLALKKNPVTYYYNTDTYIFQVFMT